MARPDFDAHQINITYYSALGKNDDAYLAARALQFFAPGVPQVYYVGLLAGENDPAAVEQTGERRAINRHDYTVDEVDQALELPVVQRLLELIRFRNRYPAFDGEFEVIPAGEDQVRLAWHRDDYRCELEVDLAASKTVIHFRDEAGNLQKYIP
jgi:sucrose phosphorylase